MEARDFSRVSVHCDTDTPIFMNKANTKRLKASGVQNMLRTLRKPSGVARLHCHLLRATSATSLAKFCIQIDVINSQEHIKAELQKAGFGYC